MIGIRIALDIGKARIGVAKSDPMGILASPLKTVARTAGNEDHLAELAETVREHNPIVVYVGDPINLKDKTTVSTDDSRNIAKWLQKSGVQVRLIDERFTTVTAQSKLHATGKTVKSSRHIIDQAAAAVLLQHALETEEQTGQFAGREVILQEEEN